jgi:hypothetical protein
MSIQIEPAQAGNKLHLDVGESFLPDDARRLHAIIEECAPGTVVDIDFRRVRDCPGYALSLLANDMLSGRALVAVHGLSQRDERLLEYLGVQAPPSSVPVEERV